MAGAVRLRYEAASEGTHLPITIVSIPVTDAQRAKRFYTDVMDFKLLRESPMGPEMTWIQLQPRDGGCTVTLTTWFDFLKPGGQQGLMLRPRHRRSGAARQGPRRPADRGTALGPLHDGQGPGAVRLRYGVRQRGDTPMPFTIVSIPGTDAQRAKRFYTDVMDSSCCARGAAHGKRIGEKAAAPTP